MGLSCNLFSGQSGFGHFIHILFAFYVFYRFAYAGRYQLTYGKQEKHKSNADDQLLFHDQHFF